MGRRLAILALVLGIYGAPPAVSADRLTLDPATTQIQFSVDATLHTVHGTAKMTEGKVEFSRDQKAASGRIVIDAQSLETGNGLRDSRMHSALLESDRFPTIELIPTSLRIDPGRASSSHVILQGQIEIHGGRFPVQIPAEVQKDGSSLQIQADFSIPYVKWGMKDMSLFMLTVAPVISVHIDAHGELSTRGGEQSSRGEWGSRRS